MSARARFPGSVWPDMLALYGAADVAPVCLALQESADVDVPLLLVLVLADRARLGASESGLAALAENAAFWRETAVRPLRTLRRALKPHASTPGDVAAFREAVKRLELEAERLHVARLAEAFAALPDGPGPLAPVYLTRCGVDAGAAARARDIFDAALVGLATGAAPAAPRQQ